MKLTLRLKGGDGSGNFGHAGRPGKVGGSAAADVVWQDWRAVNRNKPSSDTDGRYDTNIDGMEVSIMQDTFSANGGRGPVWTASFHIPHPKKGNDALTVFSDEEWPATATGLAQMKKYVETQYHNYRARLDKMAEKAAKPAKRTRRTAAQRAQDNFVLYD